MNELLRRCVVCVFVAATKSLVLISLISDDPKSIDGNNVLNKKSTPTFDYCTTKTLFPFQKSFLIHSCWF